MGFNIKDGDDSEFDIWTEDEAKDVSIQKQHPVPSKDKAKSASESKEGSSDESMKRFANTKLKFDDHHDIDRWPTDDIEEDSGKQRKTKPKNEDNGSNKASSDDSEIKRWEKIAKQKSRFELSPDEEQEIISEEEIPKEKRPTERKGKKTSNRKDVKLSGSNEESSDDTVKMKSQSKRRSQLNVNESSTDEEQKVSSKKQIPKKKMEKSSKQKPAKKVERTTSMTTRGTDERRPPKKFTPSTYDAPAKPSKASKAKAARDALMKLLAKDPVLSKLGAKTSESDSDN